MPANMYVFIFLLPSVVNLPEWMTFQGLPIEMPVIFHAQALFSFRPM
jgi:hypothetical protein